MRIDLINLRSYYENDSGPWDSDEPYVLIQIVALTDIFAGIQGLKSLGIDVPSLNLPSVRTMRFGPWSGVDAEETVQTIEIPPGLSWEQEELIRRFVVVRDPIWGPTGSWPIGDPNQLFIHVAAMESDGTDKSRVNTAIQSLLLPEVISAINNGETHEQLSRRLRDFLKTNIGVGTLDVFNSDDQIGEPQELLITPELVQQVESGQTIYKDLIFVDFITIDDEPNTKYRVRFRFRP
jgi:hypothetical protein